MLQQTITSTTCANCGAALQGRFCHQCGQKAVTSRLTLRDLFHEALHEIAHLDGKLVQTAGRLALSPGTLTNEFLAGRRARYVAPLRVYLICSVLFFALAALAPETTRSVITVTRSGSEPAGSDKLGPLQLTPEQIRERIAESFLHNMPRVMFVLMPLFAFYTWAFYRKRHRYYVAHLYHALHFHAFVFLVMAVWIVLALAGRYGRAAGQLAVLTVIPYYYLGLSRVFGGSKLQTAVKGTTVAVLYWLSLGGVIIGLVLLVLKSRE